MPCGVPLVSMLGPLLLSTVQILTRKKNTKKKKAPKTLAMTLLLDASAALTLFVNCAY